MSRLASFRGPSAPSSAPVPQANTTPKGKGKGSNPKSPSSPARGGGTRGGSVEPMSPSAGGGGSVLETTYHRTLRKQLFELRTCCRTWEDLIDHDGFRAIQRLVDARTDLDNQLAQVPGGGLPRSRIVGPKLTSMEERIRELDGVIAKLRKQFAKMNSIADNLEALLADAHKTKGWGWVSQEALWTTWTLEKFVTEISSLLPPHRRSLEEHAALVEEVRSHDTPFAAAREAVLRWAAPGILEDESWDARWEDLCDVEVDKWDPR
ncbi:hypothetical protein PENSPDRAFT_757232 [Peniophora sp. CONT]|nr:hypothetical protein PENSPDRAFT_757232 [Peniophora sp. CONT]